jgi:uncharacterized protein (DUF433 family)
MHSPIREIISDPEIMGGTPVFAGTRVPFDGLMEYIEAGETIDDFVRDFPTVTREQAVRALEEAIKFTEDTLSESSS